MASSFVFTLCLAALAGSVSAIRRGSDSIATELEGASTCCCFSEEGSCATKKVKQGENIKVPSSGEYCCKLRKGSGCEYHAKKYGKSLAEILGETFNVDEGACTWKPAEIIAEPPADTATPDEELEDVNDPAPPVKQDTVDEVETEDEDRSPAGYSAEGAPGAPKPVTSDEDPMDDNDSTDTVDETVNAEPVVEDAGTEVEDEDRVPPGYVAEGATDVDAEPDEELMNDNDSAPPVETDVAPVVQTEAETEDDSQDEEGVDLTGFMQDKKERTAVTGITYACCCNAKGDSLQCEMVDVNSAEKVNWKSGCGGFKGDGWHSYNSMGSKYEGVENIGKCWVEASGLAKELKNQ